jgi:phosphate starvation-inducible PhoH-like protein
LTNEADSYELTLEPVDNERLANLCGQFDEHLRLIEARLGVEISNRGNLFHIRSGSGVAEQAGTLLRDLYASTKDTELTPNGVHLQLQESDADAVEVAGSTNPEEVVIRTRRGSVRARSPNQRRYLQRILDHDINFGVGPAGTGKTYLAVACAVDALERDRVRRIVLVRPAVEAGERLGFLPGDMAQKIDPYLRPLYDALYEMLGFERVAKLMDRDVIEVAPLAFMRGRTLNESFIILDEAQNTSKEQMKMFLTRIGFGATAVVTGDVTQVDLPKGQRSGLRHALEVLKGIDGIAFTVFNRRDVFRHPLVQRIVAAYERSEHEE